MDFRGYELALTSEDEVPIGSLDYLSTKYEVWYLFTKKRYLIKNHNKLLK